MSKKKDDRIDIYDMFSTFQEKYGWVKCDDPAFKKALDALINTDDNLCIMGSAGAGKSTLLKIAYDILPMQSKLVTASTGVAASNITLDGIPAATLHSALRIPVREWYDPSRVKNCVVKVLEFTDLLLIDEVSMLSCNIFDYVLAALEKANRKRTGKGLKACRCIVFGDVCQLPPVVNKDGEIFKLFEERYDGKTFFFHAERFFDFFGPTSRHNLYHPYRQDEDEKEFAAALGEIRMGTISDRNLELINSHVQSLDNFAKDRDDFLYVVSTNKAAQSMNEKYSAKFKALGKEPHTYEAVYKDLTSSSFPAVPQKVTLYEGMKVIATANSEDGNYFNGSFGRIVSFDCDGYPVVAFKSGNTCCVKPNTWKSYYYSIEDGVVKPTLAGSCEQIALLVGFACTYHKLQSLTLENVYLTIHRWFLAPSSIYIGLSRIRKIAGLGLNTQLRKEDICLDSEALEYLSGTWTTGSAKTNGELELPF